MLYRRNAIQLGIEACRKQEADSLFAVVLHIGTNDIIKGEETRSPGSTIGELRTVRRLGIKSVASSTERNRELKITGFGGNI